MKKETRLLVVFGLVGLTALVVVLSSQRRSWGGDDPAMPGAGGNGPEETAADRELFSVYLTHYSHRKFAPLLALLAARLESPQAERLSAILTEREITFARARTSAAKLGMPLEHYFEVQTGLLKKKIADEFGAELGTRVDDYIGTLPQRLMVGGINQILVYRRAPMSVEQMEQLCTLLHAREVARPGRAPSLPAWDAFIVRKESAYRQVLAEAAGFLTPVQVRAVEEELDLQVAQLRSQRRTFRTREEPMDR